MSKAFFSAHLKETASSHGVDHKGIDLFAIATSLPGAERIMGLATGKIKASPEDAAKEGLAGFIKALSLFAGFTKAVIASLEKRNITPDPRIVKILTDIEAGIASLKS
jgi:hypothetical protein